MKRGHTKQRPRGGSFSPIIYP